jgi:hypothetical protein
MIHSESLSVMDGRVAKPLLRYVDFSETTFQFRWQKCKCLDPPQLALVPNFPRLRSMLFCQLQISFIRLHSGVCPRSSRQRSQTVRYPPIFPSKLCRSARSRPSPELRVTFETHSHLTSFGDRALSSQILFSLEKLPQRVCKSAIWNRFQRSAFSLGLKRFPRILSVDVWFCVHSRSKLPLFFRGSKMMPFCSSARHRFVCRREFSSRILLPSPVGPCRRSHSGTQTAPSDLFDFTMRSPRAALPCRRTGRTKDHDEQRLRRIRCKSGATAT